jgi:putative oxidoreductase
MTAEAQATTHAWAPRLWYVFAREWLGRFPFWILQLGLRVGVGLVFFNAGLLKFKSFEFAVKLFQEEYKVPLLDPVIAARMTTFVELVFPVLLFVGLASRLATLPLLGEISVIQIFVYKQAWTDHVFWVSALLLILTRGPGIFSLDYLIDRYFQRRSSRHATLIASAPPNKA